MSTKQVAAISVVVTVVALASLGVGFSLVASAAVGLVIILLPTTLVAVIVGLGYLRRRRADAPPMEWGDSFGSAKMHRRSAIYLAVTGIFLGVCAGVYLDGGMAAAVLIAAGGVGCALNSLLLAAHSG